MRRQRPWACTAPDPGASHRRPKRYCALAHLWLIFEIQVLLSPERKPPACSATSSAAPAAAEAPPLRQLSIHWRASAAVSFACRQTGRSPVNEGTPRDHTSVPNTIALQSRTTACTQKSLERLERFGSQSMKQAAINITCAHLLSCCGCGVGVALGAGLRLRLCVRLCLRLQSRKAAHLS